MFIVDTREREEVAWEGTSMDDCCCLYNFDLFFLITEKNRNSQTLAQLNRMSCHTYCCPMTCFIQRACDCQFSIMNALGSSSRAEMPPFEMV